MKRTLLLALILCATTAQATLYDLRTDWSNTANPNGVWQLDKDVHTPFAVVQHDWFGDGSNQIAWADEPLPLQRHVPVWFQATVILPGYDYILYDVVMHGAVQSRTGSWNTAAVWTSPINGVATMSGNTWMVRHIGRRMDWLLLKNDVILSQGHLFDGDGYSRANPFDLGAGSGNILALTQTVAVGDRLELRFQALDDVPDFAGVNFRVNAVPEPATLAVLALGALALMRRRR